MTENHSSKAGSLRGPRFFRAAAFLAALSLLLVAAASCGSGENPGDGGSGPERDEEPAAVVEPPVGGLAATLEDKAEELPDEPDRIRWSTDWKLCWEPYPQAAAYELQPLTGEGQPGALQRQDGTCFRIEAAANENLKDEGLKDRDALLALQQGQLGYQVRAVLPEGRVSEWSAPAAVGEERAIRDLPPGVNPEPEEHEGH